jgi:peptide deformylase
VRCDHCGTRVEKRCRWCFRIGRELSGHILEVGGHKVLAPIEVPALPRLASEAVKHIQDPLVAEMKRVLQMTTGRALSAPQIGVFRRLVVLDPEIAELAGTDVLANPAIIRRENEQEMDEACLSVPGYAGPVRRYDQVVARVGLEGDRTEIEAEGLLAQVLQHEIDHMSGTLFIDLLVGDMRRVNTGVDVVPTMLANPIVTGRYK